MQEPRNQSSVALRIQGLSFSDQIIILARLAESRVGHEFSPKDIQVLLDASSLPRPANFPQVIATLKKRRLLTPLSGRLALTPLGRSQSLALVSDFDLSTFQSECAHSSSILGKVVHTIVPPELAPPQLLIPLRSYLEKCPFETNVFGMCRFPRVNKKSDPMKRALETARDVCDSHGLQFHLATDSAIVPDLWENVTAHMWASRYGIALFEDTVDEGLNLNLMIEAGSMLMAGRRCAMLKDVTVDKLPIDLVGKIYKDVDLHNVASIKSALSEWIVKDLGLK